MIIKTIKYRFASQLAWACILPGGCNELAFWLICYPTYATANIFVQSINLKTRNVLVLGYILMFNFNTKLNFHKEVKRVSRNMSPTWCRQMIEIFPNCFSSAKSSDFVSIFPANPVFRYSLDPTPGLHQRPSSMQLSRSWELSLLYSQQDILRRRQIKVSPKRYFAVNMLEQRRLYINF